MITARIPLLYDRHTHISFYAALGGAADLSGCKTLEAALSALKKRRGPLIVARGWKNNLFDLPPEALDRLGPAAVCNISLHSFRINSAARKMLAPLYPEVIARLDDQAWVERHLPDVFGLFTAAAGAAEIQACMARLASLGIWAAEDMLISSEAAARVLAESYAGRCSFWAAPGDYERLGAAGKEAVRGLKLFADGALGARTAALARPYKGGGRGLLLRSGPELEKLIRSAAAVTGRVAIHAIGDAALEQVLSALEAPGTRRKVREVRIEHAQLITPGQAGRAKELGVRLCMQPNFSGDSVSYADRLGARYARQNNPFRMLIDEAGFVPGKDLFFGSDGMPHGAAAALEGALFPPMAGQRLTLEEFAAGYCLPDLEAGWLELSIDPGRKKVGVKVRLKDRAV